MRARFSFAYGTRLTDEEEARIAPLLDKPLERAMRRGDDGMSTQERDGDVVAGFVSYTGDIRRVLAALPAAARIEIQGEPDPAPLLDIADRLDEISMRLALRERGAEPDAYVNGKVDVHVPGFALMAISEVKVFEDFCTEALQDKLAEGWRIVAVCPQPDRRRPDYVLGRTS